MLQKILVLLVALILLTVFCSLGVWQLNRRTWKLDLIERVETKLAQAPVPAPGRDAWNEIDKDTEYLPVAVRGRFLHAHETLVGAMTSYGSGHWVLTPFLTERGFLVFINRGFVDPAHREPAARAGAQPEDVVEVSGLLRLNEPRGRLWQDNRPEEDRWYSRDVVAMGAHHKLAAEALAPYFIDAGAEANPGGWPVGGLTVVQFRNTHMGYAITWFALAGMTLFGAAIFLRSQPSDL